MVMLYNSLVIYMYRVSRKKPNANISLNLKPLGNNYAFSMH